jgi:hypothetical protein
MCGRRCAVWEVGAGRGAIDAGEAAVSLATCRGAVQMEGDSPSVVQAGGGYKGIGPQPNNGDRGIGAQPDNGIRGI